MGNGAGAAGYKTVRPDQTITSLGWTETGAATTLHGATSDDLDATYIEDEGTSTYPSKLGFAAASSVIGATERVKAVRARLRYRDNSANSSGPLAIVLQRDSSTSSGYTSNFPQTSQVITDAAGAWFTTTAQGNEWGSYVDSFVFKIGPTSALWGGGSQFRMYELYADIDIRELLTLGTPVVTNTALQRPTITWTPTLNADGDPQKKYDIYVYPASSYGAAGFSPGVPVGSGGQPWAWSSGQITSAAASVQVGADLTYGTTYRVYMRVAQDFNGADWWTGYSNDSGFTPAVPGDATPVPPTPTVTRTVDPDRARTTLAVSSAFNLLGDNVSTVETDTTGWTAGTSTSIARQVTPAAHATASLKLTRNTTTGDATAITATGASGVRVLPSTTYTALASFRTAATARTCKVRVLFYDSAGAYISGSDLLATGAADNSSTFTQVTITGSSPATAYRAAVELQVIAAVATEVHYADKVGLHPGSSTTWTRGGYLTADGSLVVEYQEVDGSNFLSANQSDSGDSGGNTVGFNLRTAADLLDRYGGASLAGEHSIRWGPSAAGSVLDVGFLTTSPNYAEAPLAAAGQTMTASVYARAQTGTFGVALILGYHNAAGSVTSVTGSTIVVGTDWQRISVSLAVPDGALYAYVALDNASDTTTGRLLVDKLQLEVGATATDWNLGSGDRPAAWTALRASPIAGTDLPVEQAVWLQDYEAAAHKSIRLYRVRAEVADLFSGVSSTLVSAYVYAAAYQTLTEGAWWLKDVVEPSANWSTFWMLDTLAESIAEDVETVHPLGRDYPVSVSSWISAGSDGTLQIRTSGEADWLALERLLRRQYALLLQSSGGLNKYVRLLSRGAERRGPRGHLQRIVSVSYQQEEAP